MSVVVSKGKWRRVAATAGRRHPAPPQEAVRPARHKDEADQRDETVAQSLETGGSALGLAQGEA